MNRLRATKRANQSQSHEMRDNADKKSASKRDSQSLTNADKKDSNTLSQRKRETREHES